MKEVNKNNQASNVNSNQQPVQKVIKKSKKKKWIKIVIVVIVVLYLIVNISARFYIINKAHEIVKEALLKTTNQAISALRYVEFEDTEDISELKNRISQHKDYMLGQINDLKARGEMEVSDQEMIIYCDDGTSEEYHPNKIPCYGRYTKNTVRGELKEFTINGSNAIINIASSPIPVMLAEYQILILENIENSKKNPTNIVSNVLDDLLYLGKIVVVFQTVRDSVYDSTSNETGDRIEVDAKEYITNLEEFANNLNKPTEQEINNLKFKESCVELFKNVDKRSTYAQAFKTSIWQKLLFMRYSVPKICQSIEDNQKQNAIKTLKSIEDEKIPMMLIEKKFYLNLMAECSDEWISIPGEEKPCTDIYSENFKKGFLDKLK